MGISTIRSYRGAQIFEAIGLGKQLSDTYFGGMPSPIDGIGLEEIARDYKIMHDYGFENKDGRLDFTGEYCFRKGGNKHAWNPDTIRTLQLATRTGSYKKFKEFTNLSDHKEAPIFIRDFFDFKRNPISIDKVEPIESIMKRFVTGAMSFGALSKEAHEAIALAMNSIHSRSNTGRRR